MTALQTKLTELESQIAEGTNSEDLAVDAKKNEVGVHVYIQHVTGFAQQSQQRILNILTFEDLKKIEAAPLKKST